MEKTALKGSILGGIQHLAEVEQGRGTSYDDNVVDACLRLFRDRGYSIPD